MTDWEALHHYDGLLTLAILVALAALAWIYRDKGDK